jgi:hypothetical protein
MVEKKETAYVIDMTPTFEADVQTFHWIPCTKRPFFCSKVSSFPSMEIKTVKTYATTPNLISLSPAPRIGTNLPSALDSGVLTVELNTSMIALPKVPMRKRTFDPRVGFSSI